MTLDEARELLGVDADVDARALRRAYLRAVKAHPPERDPEGFARVREAREACQLALVWQPAALDVAPAEPLATPQRSPGEQALLDRCGDHELAPEERLEAAERALASMPDEPVAFWAKYAALLQRTGEQGALAWLREGHALGLDGCVEEIALQYPRSLTDDDLATLLARRPFPMDLALPLAKRAGAQVAAILVEAMEAEEAGEPLGFWSGAAVYVILVLLAADQSEAGRRLYERLLLHMERAGTQARVGVDGASWLLTRELMELPQALSPELRAVFAQAILAIRDDPESSPASARLRVYGTIHARWAKQLRGVAPNLAALVLASGQRRSGPRLDDASQRGLVLIAIVISMAASQVIRAGACTEQPLGPRAHLQDIPIIPLGVVDPEQRDRSLLELSALYHRVCPGAGANVCAELSSLHAAVLRGDCLTARMAHENLRRWQPERRSDRLTLGRAIPAVCPQPVRQHAPDTTLDATTLERTLDASAPVLQSVPPPREQDETSP